MPTPASPGDEHHSRARLRSPGKVAAQLLDHSLPPNKTARPVWRVRWNGRLPHMLVLVSYIGERRASSLVAFLLSVGLSMPVARLVALICAAGLLGAAWRVARRADGDRRAFGLAVMAALTATPVVWPHYLVLLFVPIALLSPRLSAMWFLPMLAGLVPLPLAHPHIWASLPDLVIELAVVVQLCSPLRHRHEPVSDATVPPALAPANSRGA